MDYKLAKQLKDAGFPVTSICIGDKIWINKDNKSIVISKDELEIAFNKIVVKGEWYKIPTLSELIEACGDKFNELIRYYQGDGFLACASGLGKDGMAIAEEGKTPDEAVAKLWLELNDKTIQ
jgi:hypothetical protein